MKRILLAALLPVFLLGAAMPAHAQEEAVESRQVEAVVTKIQSTSDEEGIRQMVFDVETEDGETHAVDTSTSYVEGLRYDIKEGTRVLVQLLPAEEGETAHLVDVIRLRALYVLGILFALVVIAVGFWRGLFALVGLAVTVAILFGVMFPMILAGKDPVAVVVIGSAFILAINMHLSHGVSKSTLASFGSTIIGLALALIFSKIFVDVANLSGLASEESAFLFWQEGMTISPRGLLLAGIVLGATGVLDDIAVTQAETVQELRAADEKLSRGELFKRAMRVGRHHIASTVNTLVLAYVGVALPLILLFMNSTTTTAEFLNTELVAEEVIRTLGGTFALILTVPIATYLATLVPGRGKGHSHEGH